MKTLFQILSAVLLGFSPIVANAALQNGKILTDVTVGEVYTLDAKAKPVRVIPGQYHDQGSTFSTKEDSTIQLVFSNGATLLLSPNTTVVVRTFKQVPINLPAPGKYLEVDREPSPSVTEIILEKGKVVGEVRKLNSQSSYTIRTGVGIVKIKGTIFTVAYAEDVAKGAGNIETSCVRGSVDLTLFGSNSGAVPVEAGKRITAQGPIVDENGKTRSGLDVKAVAEARETKNVTVGSTQGLSKGMVAEGEGIPPNTKIESVDSDTEITLSIPVIVSADTKLKFKKGEDGAAIDIPEIIPVTLSVSKLDAKQIGDIATVLSTGSSLPVAVINAVKETAVTAPPPGSPETTSSTPISPNELPETPKKSVTETPTINQVINTVVNNTQTVIEREQQTNPSPVQ
ncbi:hypothetical protein EBR11_02285 [bacterium]|nr:hypothetical protein [bacterium]